MSRFRLAFSVFLTALCVTVSYEIKPSIPLNGRAVSIIGLLSSIVIALVVAPVIVNHIIEYRKIRRLILGNMWLEGVWIIEAYDNEDNFIRAGVSQKTYEGPDLRLRVTSYFPKGIQHSSSTSATSGFVYLRPGDLFYMSYFSTAADLTFVGVAVGYFYRDSGVRVTSRYEGRTFYFDGRASVRQVAFKITDKDVGRLINEYGSGWREYAIAHHMDAKKEFRQHLHDKFDASSDKQN